jgi:uncharacterized membrane protein
MAILVLGLLIFLGTHSIRIFAEGWRDRQRARLGEHKWKGLFSLVSAVGLGLIVWGFGRARYEPVVLWTSPMWTRHLAGLLVLVAFVLVAAAYVPRNHLKAKFHHPMVAGVKSWALAHLLANGTLADVVLFGSFLVWAVLDFRASRRRDRREAIVYRPGSLAGDAAAFVAGAVGWVVFAFWGHEYFIGVRPFG